MKQLGDYVLSVTAAAIIIGILTSLMDGKGGAAALVKMIGGLFLAFVIVQPIAKLDVSAMLSFTEGFARDGETAAAEGENMAAEAVADIIKTNTQAYILDKAETYRAELTVEVTLSQDQVPVPVAASLKGNVSPYAKAQLQKILEDDLGIPKENQLWIG